MRLATKSARVKVLVLVYELNVKVTYFKSLAKNNSKLCKKSSRGKIQECEGGWVVGQRDRWVGTGWLAKNVTHIYIISFSQLLDATRKRKVKSRKQPRGAGDVLGGVPGAIHNGSVQRNWNRSHGTGSRSRQGSNIRHMGISPWRAKKRDTNK